MRSAILCTAAVVALALAGAASAHHSQSAYVQSEEVVIEGTVAEVAWRNPHVYLTLEVAGPDGETLRQPVEVVSVPAARSLGLTPEAIAPGERVAVRAHPSRIGPGRSVFGLDVTTSDGAIYPLSTQGRNTRLPDATVPTDSLAGRWAPVHDPRLVPTVRGWPLSELAREAMAAPSVAGGAPAASNGCAALPPPFAAVLPEARTIELGVDVVRITYEPNGVEVVQAVRLDLAEHPADLELSLAGDAIGRWEGDTLVIDSVGFEPHRGGLGFGAPAGAGKHVVERLTLTEDRLHIRYELTIEDPEYLTAPASYSVLWAHRPDLEASEACDLDVAERYLVE
jgi:hypothetical protein